MWPWLPVSLSHSLLRPNCENRLCHYLSLQTAHNPTLEGPTPTFQVTSCSPLVPVILGPQQNLEFIDPNTFSYPFPNDVPCSNSSCHLHHYIFLFHIPSTTIFFTQLIYYLDRTPTLVKSNFCLLRTSVSAANSSKRKPHDHVDKSHIKFMITYFKWDISVAWH